VPLQAIVAPLLAGEGLLESVYHPGHALEDRGVLAFRQMSGDPSPDRVQIDIHQARGNRPFIVLDKG